MKTAMLDAETLADILTDTQECADMTEDEVMEIATLYANAPVMLAALKRALFQLQAQEEGGETSPVISHEVAALVDQAIKQAHPKAPQDCPACQGKGYAGNGARCENCGGSGK